MTLLLKYNLIAHIIFGLLAIMAFYAVWLNLIKQKLNLDFLKFISLSGFLMIVLSWITGGYYYLNYYSPVVGNIVKAGPYPWAHAIFTESKEHIFLFMPFLALIIYAIIWILNERIEQSPALKKSILYLSALTSVLGIIITLSGVIISGAVR